MWSVELCGSSHFFLLENNHCTLYIFQEGGSGENPLLQQRVSPESGSIA